MASILVLFASHFGQTRAIAKTIAEELRIAGNDVDLVDARRPDVPPPEDYDVVVLGSRIELGRHASAIRAFVAAHHEALTEMPCAFFSVSMAAATPGASPDPNGYMTALFEDTAWRPQLSAAFAGALLYQQYNWLTRLIMKRISKAAGHTTDTSRDHEFTDWRRVRAFARSIAEMTAVREREHLIGAPVHPSSGGRAAAST
jgi:menaquinone-dependent protoporphyrinogen oxidase